MYGAFQETFLHKLRHGGFCHVWSTRGVFPDTLMSGKCHHMKANQTRSRRQAEAGKNKRLFFFHFRGQFCFDLVKINQVFRMYVIKYCLIQFSIARTFRKRDKRDNWLEKEAWKRFFGRKYSLIPAALLIIDSRKLFWDLFYSLFAECAKMNLTS